MSDRSTLPTSLSEEAADTDGDPLRPALILERSDSLAAETGNDPPAVGGRPVRGPIRSSRHLMLASALLAAWAAGLAGFIWSLTPREGLVAPGVTVSGIAVGGMERAAAHDVLAKRLAEATGRPMTLADGTHTWEVTARELGYSPDAAGTLDAALAVGRQGGILQRIHDAWQARKHGLSLDARWHIDRKKMGRRLARVARAARIPARDATIRFNGRGFDVSEDADGHAVDADATEKNLVRYFDPATRDRAALVSGVEAPRVRAGELKRINARLVSFTTRFNPGDANRTQNLRLAAEALHGAVIPAGEVFSYNDSVGPRSLERGYRVAKIFLKGEILDGVGGGICQVATTLYNAAYEVKLPILERARHSRPVTYAPPGRDATVSYGGVDLKFRNNTPAPLLIQTRVLGGSLTVSLYGSRPERKAAHHAADALRPGRSGRS